MVVRAKRLGWNEQLTDEQLLDMDPLEKETDSGEPISDDLEGELEIVEVDAPEPVGHLKIYFVGGKSVDHETIEEVK